MLSRSVGGSDLASVYDPDGYLDEDKFMYFWVSWTDGELVVGNGTIVGVSALVSYQDLDPYHVTAVAFTTGNLNQGIFEFLKNIGMNCL